MKTKEKTIEEEFATATDKGFPEFKNLFAERAEIHAVLGLTLVDIYDSESKRLAAKYGKNDTRVAMAKLKKTDAGEKAKEIIEILMAAKVAVSKPAPNPSKPEQPAVKRTPKPAPKPKKPSKPVNPKPVPKPTPKPKPVPKPATKPAPTRVVKKPAKTAATNQPKTSARTTKTTPNIKSGK